jgi:hypothetical protein
MAIGDMVSCACGCGRRFRQKRNAHRCQDSACRSRLSRRNRPVQASGDVLGRKIARLKEQLTELERQRANAVGSGT